jgi:hyperosmotically inducible periplasmic protein
MFARFVAAAVAVLALSAPAFAADKGNLQTFRDVQRQVLRYPHFTIFDSVNTQIDNGVVTLTGKVTMPYKRDDLARRIANLPNVQQVNNRLEVLPVSQFDDELRFRIARAIYSNSSFWNYAAMANPPIRVVVNRGRVTLEGVVQSNVERMLARSLASGFGEFELKNDLRTDAEVRESMETRKSN